MKISLTILTCLFFVVLFGQTETCVKLKSANHQRANGASSNNECCVDAAELADKLLLNALNVDSITTIHAPFGIPKTENRNEILLINPTYLIGYDTVHKIPMWVQYKLQLSTEIDKKIKRSDCFRYDPRLPKSSQASYNDFSLAEKDTLQRGHIKPSADGYRSQSDNLNTFIMSNMAPQYESFNMCEWQILEAFVQSHSKGQDISEAYVISGSVVKPDASKLNDKVTIPSAFYKIYFFKKAEKWHYWTFYIEHDAKLMDFDQYKDQLLRAQLPIDEIEKLAGINIFVTAERENEIELITDGTLDLSKLPKYKSMFCSRFSDKKALKKKEE